MIKKLYLFAILITLTSFTKKNVDCVIFPEYNAFIAISNRITFISSDIEIPEGQGIKFLNLWKKRVKLEVGPGFREEDFKFLILCSIYNSDHNDSPVYLYKFWHHRKETTFGNPLEKWLCAHKHIETIQHYAKIIKSNAKFIGSEVHCRWIIFSKTINVGELAYLGFDEKYFDDYEKK